MKPTLPWIAGLLAGLMVPADGSAQVSIRVPFVRVEAGGPGGTYVRAPFVRIYTGPRPPVFYGPPPFLGPPPPYGPPPYGPPPYGPPIPGFSNYGPAPVIVRPPQPPAPGIVQQGAAPARPTQPKLPVIPQPLPPGPQAQAESLPVPRPHAERPANPDLAPPAPAKEPESLTLEQFSKAFQPKAGSYEITFQNPVSRQPTTVRFNLPAGTPEKVDVGRSHIEYRYSARQFVRIEFDEDGATVISR